MEVLYARCCGLDVHKSSITACVLITQAGKPQKQIRRFGATTHELRELVAWLQEFGVEHVAMESTGVYWKPVWNVLEGQFQIVLANAQHIKAVPGRKTDTKDCQWIAELLQHGLLRASYIPSVLIRDLRDLTRMRASLSQEASRIASRIQKVLEDANIKLASVASNTLGKSGRAMLEAIIRGEESSERLADLALGHLRAKIPQLQIALEGQVRDHHRFLLRSLLRQLQFLEAEIALLDARLDQIGREHLELADALDRWITVPGVERVAAWSFIAEMGTDVAQFPSAAHLASWAGICPGNNESAGKRKSGKITKGDVWLRAALTEAAHAVSHAKNTYLSSQYHRLAARRGKKRAIIAVAHSILRIVFHLLAHDCEYVDLGSRYLEERDRQQIERSLVRRLEKL